MKAAMSKLPGAADGRFVDGLATYSQFRFQFAGASIARHPPHLPSGEDTP